MPPAMGGLQASPDFLKPSATPPIPNVVASVADVAALAANGTPVAKATLLVDPTTKLLYGQSDGQGGYVPIGSGSGSGGSLVARSDTVTGNALLTSAPAKVFAVTRISGSGTYSLHNGVTTATPIPTGWSAIDGPTGTPYTPTQQATDVVNGLYFELVSGSGTFLIVWALG